MQTTRWLRLYYILFWGFSVFEPVFKGGKEESRTKCWGKKDWSISVVERQLKADNPGENDKILDR